MLEVYLKELKFKSLEPTYIQDITPEVREAVKKSEVETGLTFVRSLHTTLGVILTEVIEPNLRDDMIDFSLSLVGEDLRGNWFKEKNYDGIPRVYKHWCGDNPRLRPDEEENDANAGRHLRALLFSQPGVFVPIMNNELQLGRFQDIGIFEFDGRDGTGSTLQRDRTVQVWIYPYGGVRILE